MQAYLKIKIKSLAAESTLIRKDELKYRNRARAARLKQIDTSRLEEIRYGLYHHRTRDVRMESRASNLAYGYLRGLAYKSIEKTCKVPPSESRIADLVAKYGKMPRAEALTKIRAWISE